MSASPSLLEQQVDLQHDFLLDDEGNSVVPLPSHEPVIASTSRPLSRVSSRRSRLPDPLLAVPRYVIELTLDNVCDYIDHNESLRSAEIISTECYRQQTGAVRHRFIILQLRRPGRKDEWLRLDRRRGEGVSILKFFAGSGTTKANDRAVLSPDKVSLIQQGTRENTQEFTARPTLAEFTRLLRIITEEIATYRIWPENCWFFCSLIQQHLGDTQTGWYVEGKAKYADLAKEIKTRIYSRIWVGRPTLPEPEASGTQQSPHTSPPMSLSLPPTAASPMPPVIPSLAPLSPVLPLASPNAGARVHYDGPTKELTDVLENLRRDESLDEDIQIQVAEALKLASNIGPTENDFDPVERETGSHLVSLLRDINGYMRSQNKPNDLQLVLQSDAVQLERALCFHAPLLEKHRLSVLLYRLSSILASSRRFSDACAVDDEIFPITREQYKDRPSAHRADLALLLHNHGFHLHGCKRDEEACIADTEAVMLYRILFEGDPDDDGNWLDLADILYNFGTHLTATRRFEDAQKAYKECAMLYRQLYEKDPEEHRQSLAECLFHYSEILDDLGLMRERRLVLAELKPLRAVLESVPLSDDRAGNASELDSLENSES